MTGINDPMAPKSDDQSDDQSDDVEGHILARFVEEGKDEIAGTGAGSAPSIMPRAAGDEEDDVEGHFRAGL